MRTYEVLFILTPSNTEDENTSLIGDFRAIAESSGAKLVSEDAWGRRRLAYPIQKLTEGVYHLFIFECEHSLSELDRRMRISDKVLRHLVVRTDLETRRAVKLAKKNPKKERIRPMAAVPTGDGVTPEAVSEPAAVAPETTSAVEPVEVPAAEPVAVPAEPAAVAPQEESAS